MKRYVKESVEETTNELTNYVGFYTDDGRKGIFVYVGRGERVVSPICMSDASCLNVPNTSFGSSEDHRYTIEEYVNGGVKFSCEAQMDRDRIYVFEGLKELLKWASE